MANHSETLQVLLGKFRANCRVSGTSLEKVYMRALKCWLSVLVLNCLQVSSVCEEKIPLQKGPKGHECAQVQTIARVAESGLRPPFESPRLDFPQSLCWRPFALVSKSKWELSGLMWALALRTLKLGWQDRCDRVLFGGMGGVARHRMGGVARHLRDISKTAGICCDTACATLCSATGVTEMVCH